MSRRIAQPLPFPGKEYDLVHEEINRRQIEQNFEDLYADLESMKGFGDASASLAMRPYQFMTMASGVTSHV